MQRRCSRSRIGRCAGFCVAMSRRGQRGLSVAGEASPRIGASPRPSRPLSWSASRSACRLWLHTLAGGTFSKDSIGTRSATCSGLEGDPSKVLLQDYLPPSIPHPRREAAQAGAQQLADPASLRALAHPHPVDPPPVHIDHLEHIPFEPELLADLRQVAEVV